MTDSDTTYHRLFSHPIMVEHLVRDFIPDALAAGFAFDQMERVSAKFHDDRVETRRESDVIWRLPARDGTEVYLHLMLEFQSTPDWWMAVRAQVYEGLLWQQIIKERTVTEGDRLPPVLLMVIYNGTRPWTAPTTTRDLIALPEGSALWSWQPRIRYHLLDMARVPRDELIGRDTLTSLLVQLERPQQPDELERLIGAVIDWFRAHPDYADLKRLFTDLVGQALAGVSPPTRIPDDLLEMKTMLATLGEEWKQKWLAEGEALGEARGEARGVAQGMAQGMARGRGETLLHLAERRWGRLSDDQRNRILAADEQTLLVWLDRLLDARTLDDLLAPPH